MLDHPALSVTEPSHPAPYCAAPSTQFVANCASSQRDAPCGQPAVAGGGEPAGETNGTAIRAGLVHPNALLRRAFAIQHASGWDGGRLADDAPESHRVGLLASSAAAMLGHARYDLGYLADKFSGPSAASLAWRYRAYRQNKERAHRLIRHAGAALERAEKQFRGLTVPVLQDAA